MSRAAGRVGALSLDGFRSTRVLRDSGRTRVFAATRVVDQRPVLVKLYELDPHEGLEVRIEHEFRAIQGLELEGIVEALALERGPGYVALVYEWFEGINLDEHRGGRPLALAEAIGVAQQLARLLVEVHRHKLIHRNIKPSNVFVSPGGEAVALADLGVSVLLERERQRIDDAWVVESNLPYVSPEQTGRTHHGVDFRSDLYSLGVTLYELLSGRRPFDASTPLELIHAHLARRPLDLQRLRPELPSALSAIVMKLLEKAPERRYQSAAGLLADLERVAAALASGDPLDGFALATRDVPTVLQLPHRLYGRSREVERLVELFRDACGGTPKLVLVAGATGSGKTALVNQLAEPITSRRGFFARGKFEREQTDKPYSGVFAAFSNLADQLLTRSDEQLGRWRARLRERLGSSGALLTELVPRLRPLLGPLAGGPELGPLESRNRLALACTGLLAEFAKAEHPLVLSLDDFQWADVASCELLASLLVEPELALLMVVTYREDELDPRSPVAALLERGERGELEAQRIGLGPLGRDDVAGLIADTLAWPIERVRPLAEIVGRNTDHNPLFVGQYLGHLVDLGLLRPSSFGWEWDAEAIKAAGIPEDLLSMMSAKLRLLTAAQRELLGAAAVIGARFDVAGLRALVGPEVIELALGPLVARGLLIALRSGRYGFAHDRIRAAAYRMNDPERRVELHRIVGEDCLERSGYGELEESILEVVDHLDIGCGLLPVGDEEPELSRARAIRLLDEFDDQRRELLAELNAIAGHSALIGGASRAAIRYFEAGIQLLSAGRDSGSAEDPLSGPELLDEELRFSLRLGRCQALGLAGQAREAERQFGQMLGAPLDAVRIGRAVAARVEVRIAAGDRRGAIACGMDGLARLEVDPLRAGEGPEQLSRLVPLLRSPRLRALGHAPAIADPRLEAALAILTALIPVSALIDPDLHAAIVTEHVEIMLAHGRHEAAPTALSYAAMLVGTAVGQRTLALELVELAAELLGDDGPGRHRQRIEAPYWVVAAWVRPYAEALAPLRESVSLALASGDLENAGYATDMVMSLSLSAGLPLHTLERTAEAAARRLRQWQSGPFIARAEAYLGFARALLGGDEAALELELVELEHRPSEYVIRLLGAMLRCLAGRWQEGFAELDALDDFPRVVSGVWHMCDHATFHGLCAAVLLSSTTDAHERERLLQIVGVSLELLEVAGELGPANAAPRAALLEAELHAIEGDSIAALADFCRARRAAAEQRLIWLEALAAERSAVYLRSLGLDELAEGPLRDARDRFNQWGAFAKVAQLDRLWPQLGDDRSGTIALRPRPASTSASVSASGALDLQTILKASQAIADDILLDEVVDRVMAIAIENAGAERGALLLAGEAGLELRAICSAEGGSARIFERSIAVDEVAEQLPSSVLRWVERTREPAVVDDATGDLRFATDTYVSAHRVRSILCLPIVKHDRLIGLLYLENKLSPGSFTADRLELLRLLMAQAASALENAQLFEALRGSEVRWRSLVAGLPDVVMLVDHHGLVEFINHGGGDGDESGGGDGGEGRGGGGGEQLVVGRALDTLVAREHADALHEQLTRTLREACQTELELRAALRGAGQRWYALRLAPIAVDGRVERVIAVATDISERRDAAVAKQQLEAQIRQQQRLESIGTLASGVAHEINNPVQGIMNYAELIATMPDLSEAAREFAGEIGHEAQRVATIVRSLLSFSREENEGAGAGPVDVKAIVEGTLALVHTLMGKDQIALRVHAPEQPVMAVCRAQQIRQVIMNLLTNARDALCARWPDFHEDKRIDIRVEAFADEQGRGWVRISVCDRGGGVPEGVVDRIFDPFFTTKGRDQGTGLGLAVSHGIISEHGGELRLDNQVGVGACFHVELPAAQRR
ncbi:MAG: AAA family ATPase [Enhygromyxa sp.]